MRNEADKSRLSSATKSWNKTYTQEQHYCDYCVEFKQIYLHKSSSQPLMTESFESMNIM